MNDMALRSISLCSGIGGLDLGVGLAARTRTVCYLEREAFCVEHLATQMQAGRLDEAPIWSDLATFDGRAWRGAVDLVVGGYPCQPFSLAGQRKGVADERHLWPHVRRILDECGASLAFSRTSEAMSISDWMRSFKTSVAWGSMRNGACSRQAKWEPRTSEPGCSSSRGSAARGSANWPTATAMDSIGARNCTATRDGSKGGKGKGKIGRTLTDAAWLQEEKIWQTPADFQAKRRRQVGQTERKELLLPGQAEAWCTPTTRDWKDTSGMTYERRDGRTRVDLLPRQVFHDCSLPDQPTWAAGPISSSDAPKLNPQFVEMLMGLPCYWTALTDSALSETEWSRYRRLLRSDFSRVVGD